MKWGWVDDDRFSFLGELCHFISDITCSHWPLYFWQAQRQRKALRQV